MRILYNSQDGKIFYAVRDVDWFYFIHSTNIPLSIKIIDEVAPANQAICQDLRIMVGRVDKNGAGKYYIDTTTMNLMEREGWKEEPIP